MKGDWAQSFCGLSICIPHLQLFYLFLGKKSWVTVMTFRQGLMAPILRVRSLNQEGYGLTHTTGV